MLAGEKKLSVFYRYMNENFDEMSGQNFDDYVDRKIFLKKCFYVKIDDNKIKYTMYCLIEEKWRLEIYEKLKKYSNSWNVENEAIEAILLNSGIDNLKNYLAKIFS